MQQTKNYPTFSSGQIRAELRRVRRKERKRRVLKETIGSLLIVAAITVLAAMLFFPIFRVTGSSMAPTLNSDEMIVCQKASQLKHGDIIAFYYNNKVLLKRVIGISGDTLEISEDGAVILNGEELKEPYVLQKALGQCDIAFPYEVPDNRVFVMGDNRETSVDSRSSAVGCIADEYIIGKVFFRIWPFEVLGTMDN